MNKALWCSVNKATDLNTLVRIKWLLNQDSTYFGGSLMLTERESFVLFAFEVFGSTSVTSYIIVSGDDL